LVDWISTNPNVIVNDFGSLRAQYLNPTTGQPTAVDVISFNRNR
jgi:hypothetical protein